VTWYRVPEPFLTSLYFNLRDPVVGGMDAPQVALRRAIDLALDRTNLVDVVYAGQAQPANQMAPPRVAGHDPKLPSAARADPAAARALLDRYGYKVGQDGMRTARDGTPLTITIMLRSGAVSREVQTLLRKNLMAIGLRTDFHVVPFQDAIKELTLGQYQMWFGSFGGNPTAYGILSQLYSKAAPQINVTRFNLPDYDAAIERFMRTRDPAEQTAAARRAAEIQRAYMPIAPVVFRIDNYFVQPWLTGFRPNRFDTYWKYYDIDTTKQPRGKPAQ
jgi:ABC-type transport system substrate-binding protein